MTEWCDTMVDLVRLAWQDIGLFEGVPPEDQIRIPRWMEDRGTLVLKRDPADPESVLVRIGMRSSENER